MWMFSMCSSIKQHISFINTPTKKRCSHRTYGRTLSTDSTFPLKVAGVCLLDILTSRYSTSLIPGPFWLPRPLTWSSGDCNLRIVGAFLHLLRPRSRLLGSPPLGLHCILIYFAQTTFSFYGRASFGFTFNAVTGLLHEPLRVRRSPYFVGRTFLEGIHGSK